MEIMRILNGALQNFDIIYKIKTPILEEERYTDIDFNQKKKIINYWYAYKVKFSMLTETQMDYLEELKRYESFQIDFNLVGSWITVILDEIDIKVINGSATFITVAAEL